MDNTYEESPEMDDDVLLPENEESDDGYPKPPLPIEKALKRFRHIAREFSDVPDDEIIIELEDARPLVGVAFFRDSFIRAWALRAAHELKMMHLAMDEAEGIFPTQSIGEAVGKQSFAINQPNINTDDGLLAQTKYGQMFLQIRNSMPVGPIM
jgi:hypothetical protein